MSKRTERLTDSAKPNMIRDENASSASFEEAMGELENIVRRLEDGGESLEKALEDYSTAIGLLKICHRTLEHAERRVEILSGFDAEGNAIPEPFPEIEETMEEKRRSRDTKRTAPRNETSSRSRRRSISENEKFPTERSPTEESPDEPELF